MVAPVAVSVEAASVGPMMMTEAGEEAVLLWMVMVIWVVEVEKTVVVGELFSIGLARGLEKTGAGLLEIAAVLLGKTGASVVEIA